MFTLSYIMQPTKIIIDASINNNVQLNIKLPANTTGIIDWGDAKSEIINNTETTLTHTYETNDKFIIKISPEITEIHHSNANVIDVPQIGTNIKYLTGYNYKPFTINYEFEPLTGYNYKPFTRDYKFEKLTGFVYKPVTYNLNNE